MDEIAEIFAERVAEKVIYLSLVTAGIGCGVQRIRKRIRESAS